MFPRLRRAGGVVWLAVALGASQPWAGKDPGQWTPGDLQKILSDSPWAQQAMATFGKALEPDDMAVTPPPGAGGSGVAGGRGVTDGRWDGGVARNTGVGDTPELPVTVRWDSALPVREALERSKDADAATVAERAERDYVITVIGLTPANVAPSAEHPADDPQQVQGFIANSRLLVRGGAAIAPEDAKIDAKTGAVHLFFPRSRPIVASDKEVNLVTRFGSVNVQKRFRLKDMMYKGQLAL
ncbi:MAG: hypothetical protein JO340_20025 [Acidobacteriaceae bacterium]|nr:hypothetical protein [Acidobacteriaceae bacterium]